MKKIKLLFYWFSGLLRSEKEITQQQLQTRNPMEQYQTQCQNSLAGLFFPAWSASVAILFCKAVVAFYSVVVSAPIGLVIAGLLFAPFANTLQADQGNSGDPTCWSKFEIQGSDTDCGCGAGCASRKKRRYDTGWWIAKRIWKYKSVGGGNAHGE